MSLKTNKPVSFHWGSLHQKATIPPHSFVKVLRTCVGPAVEAQLLASLASTLFNSQGSALVTAAAALAKLVKSGAGSTVRVMYWLNCQSDC